MTQRKQRHGPVETAVRNDLQRITAGGDLDGALRETACTLARRLDEAEAKESAPVARELRATLKEIREARSDVDDVDAFLAGLSSQVGDAST